MACHLPATIFTRIRNGTFIASWGTGFTDLDNDGWPDLFVVTGSVYPEIEARIPEYPLKTPCLVFRNLGYGKFEELNEQAGPGINSAHCSRGRAFGDFDNDGDVEVNYVSMDYSIPFDVNLISPN
ncbi:MAG TPA: FG-GAP-like repeat-containing protein [Acidobacteriaceae bacterium]|nr:FG-GAP-like repeat-containing protein [Acidobacteriaceae bacterium]